MEAKAKQSAEPPVEAKAKAKPTAQARQPPVIDVEAEPKQAQPVPKAQAKAVPAPVRDSGGCLIYCSDHVPVMDLMARAPPLEVSKYCEPMEFVYLCDDDLFPERHARILGVYKCTGLSVGGQTSFVKESDDGDRSKDCWLLFCFDKYWAVWQFNKAHQKARLLAWNSITPNGQTFMMKPPTVGWLVVADATGFPDNNLRLHLHENEQWRRMQEVVEKQKAAELKCKAMESQVEALQAQLQLNASVNKDAKQLQSRYLTLISKIKRCELDGCQCRTHLSKKDRKINTEAVDADNEEEEDWRIGGGKKRRGASAAAASSEHVAG